MKEKTIFFSSILFVCGLLAAIFWHHQPTMPSLTSASRSSAIGGVWTLTGTDGKPLSSSQISTPYTLICFGFTHCPDICPTGLQHMVEALQKDAMLAAKITPIFITLDPARDTPEVLKEYVAAFDQKLVGVTGTEAQIAEVAKLYKVYHSKQVLENSKGNYVIDHSSWIYLMDNHQQYVAHFKHDMAPETLAKELLKHVR